MSGHAFEVQSHNVDLAGEELLLFAWPLSIRDSALSVRQGSLIWRLAQVGAASLDDLNRDLLIVRQHYIVGCREGLIVDDDAG